MGTQSDNIRLEGRLGAPAMDPSMLRPLLLMVLAFMAYFATVWLIRIRAELALRRVRVLRMAKVQAAEAGAAA